MEPPEAIPIATVPEWTHTVYDQVNHLATILASEEEATNIPTAVGKKRSKIYELLLRPRTMSSETKLELLHEVSRELKQNPKRREKVHSFLESLEEKEAGDSQDTQENVENCPKAGSRCLRPGVLKLYEAPPMDFDKLWGPPTFFRSIDQMKRDLKPQRMHEPVSGLLPTHIRKPLCQTNPQALSTLSFLTGSLARMRESREKTPRPPIPKMEFLKTKKPKETPQKLREFVAEFGTEKHFLSDKMLLNELNLRVNKHLVLSYIQEATLIDHLKKAAAGLQTETFMCSPADDMELMIRPNTTMRSVLPGILADFSKPFLRAGCAHRRLSARTKYNLYNDDRLERPLTRAFREILVDFLATIRQFLLSQTANSLPQLLLNYRSPMQLLCLLENVFHREPRLNLEAGVPGCFLMSCIWQVIDTCGNSDFLQLLIYLLRRLVQTYFVQLQRWIYHGELDEDMNEIFISRYRNTSPSMLDECSKDFFNRGYQVVSQEIPAFLAGCEQDILQCGKYNQVLKAYNAQHPVFDVEFPDIVVCLTEQQLKDMRRRLAERYAVIYQRFGWCSMQSIFQERMAAKRNFKNLMVERTQAHLVAWSEQQRVQQLEANAKRKKRYEQLNAELEEHQQNVLEKRRQEIVNELVFLKESDRLEERRQLSEKEALLKEVARLQDVLSIESKSQDPSSPDDSSNSDRSFKSCLEGSYSRPESVIDRISEEEEESSELPKSSPLAVLFPRTPLDELNSNDQASLHSELERNRKHILSSEHFQAMVDVKESDSTTSGYSGLRAHLPPDINANLKASTDSDREPTDFQRYRTRMQQHDPFDNYNATEDENTRRIQRQMQDTSERAMNRRAVMGSEYDIILGERSEDSAHLEPLELNKLHVEVPVSVLTPMSITSDADFGGPLTPEAADKDAANNNNNDTPGQSSLSPQTEPVIPEAAGEALASLDNTFRLPSNFQTEIDKLEQLEQLGNERQAVALSVPEACNPFMARRCLQLSVMVPVKAHYALLRNEVLRIFKELRIYEHFCRLRNYFFLLDGQFGGLLTSDILGRIRAGIDPQSLCQKGVIDAMLSNALACCPADETTVTQNLTLHCNNIPDKLDFYSLEATSMLTLHCQVDWPLNLVISAETVAKYSQIFGYFLKLRHVSYILERTYEHLQQMGKLLGQGIRMSAHFRQLQMVRHKLAHFVTTLQTHFVAKAFQGTWKRFKEDLCTANSIEDLYKHHVSYLKRVAFLAFLNRRSAKVKETIDNMLVIVLRFCKVIQSQSFTLDLENQFLHPRIKRLLQEEAEFEKFMHYLIYLGKKAASSGYQEEIGDLICIINFNNYYIVSDQKSLS